MTISHHLLRDLTDIPAHRREMSRAAHPSNAGRRLIGTMLDTSAEDDTHAEIIRLRDSLAPVIDLDSKRGGRA